MNQLHISWGGIITVLQSGNVKLAVILGVSAADPEGLGGRHEWPPPRKNDFFHLKWRVLVNYTSELLTAVHLPFTVMQTICA